LGRLLERAPDKKKQKNLDKKEGRSVIAAKVQPKLANAQMKAHMKGIMKWLSYMSTFFVNKKCEIVKNRVHTEKGFKVIHLNVCAKQRRCTTT
jgi:hypothetical protein